METSHTASLIAVESLSASTRLFRFETGGEHLPFIAGQFYRFTFTDAVGPFERSYSFSQFDPKLPMSQFELVISAVAGGRATDLLFNAALGLTVQLKGPFGRLILPADDKRCLVLVATSVGVAPFLPMLQSLEAGEHQRFDSVHLLFGVRDPTEVLFQEALLRLRSDASWFKLTVHCSRSQDASMDWQHPGYVTSGLAQLALDPKSDHVLVCGNPKMVDDVYALLRAQHFGPRSVIREKYVFAVQEKAVQGPARSSADEALLQQKMKAYGATPATDPKPLKPV